MKIDGTDFVEKYKRPCVALCKKCGLHAVLIFEDGSYSDEINSLTEGNELLKKLVDQKVLSNSDAERISDQLACSDLPLYDEEIDIKDILPAGVVAGVLIASFIGKSTKHKGGGGSDSDIQSFSC